jgi:hypothetical protein
MRQRPEGRGDLNDVSASEALQVRDDEMSAAQVVAMQFAGGRLIVQLAEEWERDAAWVEEAIRRALRETIPKRNGGMKVSRRVASRERSVRTALRREAQDSLKW